MTAAAQSPPPVVEAKIVAAASAVHPNASLKLAVVAKVTPGYHINDHKPTLDYLIPTELTLAPPPQATVEQVVYPKGEPKKFAFSDMPLSVYEGSVAIGALLKAGRTAKPGVYALQGKLTYQACNDHACLPPASVPVTLTLKVVPRRAPVKRLNEDVFSRIQFE